jgi:hypothetical protein
MNEVKIVERSLMRTCAIVFALLLSFGPMQDATAQGFTPLPLATGEVAAPSVAPAPLPSPPAGAQPSANPAVFQDAQGRFTALIPAGWSARQQSDGSAQFTNGAAWVMLAPSDATRPEIAVNELIRQLGPHYHLAQTNAAAGAVSGHPTYYAVFRGVSGQESVAMMVAGVTAPGGRVLAYISSAPEAQINTFSPGLLQIMQGIRFAGE